MKSALRKPSLTDQYAVIEQMDVTADANALGMTCDEVRAGLREAVKAGLLSVRARGSEVVLRGEFPEDA